MRQYQVEQTLQTLIINAENQGKKSVVIISGELNKQLPFTTEKDHNRCPMCCKAMRKLFDNKTDKILNETESGESSTFSVEYGLPRMA